MSVSENGDEALVEAPVKRGRGRPKRSTATATASPEVETEPPAKKQRATSRKSTEVDDEEVLDDVVFATTTPRVRKSKPRKTITRTEDEMTDGITEPETSVSPQTYLLFLS